MTSSRALFVETNFVLGLAYGESPHYEELLKAAESKAYALFVPAFSFYEAVNKQRRNGDAQTNWTTELEKEAKSREHKQPGSGEKLLAAADELRDLSDQYAKRVEEAVRRIAGAATTIPLDAQCVEDALKLNPHLEKGDPWVAAAVRRALLESPTASAAMFTKDPTFAKKVAEWSNSTESTELTAPFRGLEVFDAVEAVSHKWLRRP